MRISDWSSDVCSSDLEQLLTSRNRITAVQGYAGTAKTTTVLTTFARQAEARGVSIVALAPTASAAMVLGEALDTRSDTVARHLLSPERPQPRSEEHTSELQSLMRISYAVFCLKKKKKTTTTSTYNNTIHKKQ